MSSRRPEATLREALQAGTGLVATFVVIPRIEIVEMLANAGFDAVIIDLEHGPITVDMLPALSAAARGCGSFAIARVADDTDATISSALDSGVDGIIVPHVVTVEHAQAVVQAGRFPSDGRRSLNPYVRGMGYGQELENALAEVDGRVALSVMLEGPDAIENLEAICAVPGLDGIFVGPVDLSGSIGYPGQPEHPIVVELLRDVFRRVGGGGKSAGIYAPSAEAAARWLTLGASLVAVSADAGMILPAFIAMRSEIDVLRAQSVSSASHNRASSDPV